MADTPPPELVTVESGSALLVATAAADIDNLRFYRRQGFRMRVVERDAFTPASGHPPGIRIDGIELRDRVWLDCQLRPAPTTRWIGHVGGGSRQSRPASTTPSKTTSPSSLPRGYSATGARRTRAWSAAPAGVGLTGRVGGRRELV